MKPVPTTKPNVCHGCWLQLGMYSRTSPVVKDDWVHLVIDEGPKTSAICNEPMSDEDKETT